mmetsp:Transcript_4082/g.25674  ORF Transcript_4082/g.25674 Transcript_4082/m.25674 type:complete len:255 (+) Transcript_4082:1712-2476(+)
MASYLVLSTGFRARRPLQLGSLCAAVPPLFLRIPSDKRFFRHPSLCSTDRAPRWPRRWPGGTPRWTRSCRCVSRRSWLRKDAFIAVGHAICRTVSLRASVRLAAFQRTPFGWTGYPPQRWISTIETVVGDNGARSVSTGCSRRRGGCGCRRTCGWSRVRTSLEREACVVHFAAFDVVCPAVCRMDISGPQATAKRRGRDLLPGPRPVGRARGLSTRVHRFDPHPSHPSQRCVTSAIAGRTFSTAVDVRSIVRLS